MLMGEYKWRMQECQGMRGNVESVLFWWLSFWYFGGRGIVGFRMSFVWVVDHDKILWVFYWHRRKGEFMLLSVFRVCFCYMLLFDREIMIFGAVGKTGIKELLQSHAIAFYFHFVWIWFFFWIFFPFYLHFFLAFYLHFLCTHLIFIFFAFNLHFFSILRTFVMALRGIRLIIFAFSERSHLHTLTFFFAFSINILQLRNFCIFCSGVIVLNHNYVDKNFALYNLPVIGKNIYIFTFMLNHLYKNKTTLCLVSLLRRY